MGRGGLRAEAPRSSAPGEGGRGRSSAGGGGGGEGGAAGGAGGAGTRPGPALSAPRPSASSEDIIPARTRPTLSLI